MFRSVFYTIGLFVLMGSLSACSHEEGYESHSGYKGKQSFDYVENNMASLMSFWDLALRMNTYVNRVDETEEGKSEELFPEYNIYRLDNNEWIGLKEQDTIFRLMKDDLALTTETAQWKIVGYRAPYEGNITISCTSLRSWKFSVSAVINGEWTSEANLKIDYNSEGVPGNFNTGDWMVSGAGRCIADDEHLLNFEIAESLIRFADSKYLFDKGIVYLRLKNFFSLKEEIVKAEMKAHSGNSRNLQITYKGEVYSY